MIVDALIERSEEYDHRKTSIVIMEPTANFEERHMLLMAASLTDMKHNVTHKVRILNPFAEPRVIADDSVIGSAEEIESMESVISLESETKAQDSQWDAVPIWTSSNETPIHNAEGTVRRVKEIPQEVPSHITDLYTKACENLSISERSRVKEMLHTHEAIFSKNEFDIGMTVLTEHAIYVGSHKPVKQPPRRVPAAFAEKEEQVIKQM